MKEKIEACFMRMQQLDLKPTEHNMEILLQTLYDLKDVYNKLKEAEANGRNDGPPADPEG